MAWVSATSSAESSFKGGWEFAVSFLWLLLRPAVSPTERESHVTLLARFLPYFMWCRSSCFLCGWCTNFTVFSSYFSCTTECAKLVRIHNHLLYESISATASLSAPWDLSCLQVLCSIQRQRVSVKTSLISRSRDAEIPSGSQSVILWATTPYTAPVVPAQQPQGCRDQSRNREASVQ